MSANKDAATIREMAANRYEILKNEYEECNYECNKSLNRIDDIKVSIWGEFNRFVDVVGRIKHVNELKSEISKEDCNFGKEELLNIKEKSMAIATAVKTAGVATVAGVGAAAASTVALGGIGLSAFGVMSVGEAAAVTMSMAEVTVAMYGAAAVFWPMAAVAAVATVAGVVFSGVHGKQELKKAKLLEEDIDKACSGLLEATGYLKEIIRIGSDLQNALEDIYDFYRNKLGELETVVDRKDDYREFDRSERYLLEATLLMTKVLKKLTQTPLLVKKEAFGETREDKETAPIVNSEAVKKEIQWAFDQKVAIINFDAVDKAETVKNIKAVSAETAQDLCTNTENTEITVVEAISINNKSLEFRNCVFTFDGGGIKTKKTGLSFDNCVFKGDNRAVACIETDGGEIRIKGCRIESTDLFLTGNDTHIFIDGTTFIGNKNLVKYNGSVFEMRDSNASDNMGYVVEGSVLNEPIIIDNCIFENCGKSSFIINIPGGEAKVKNCTFRNTTGMYLGFIGEFMNAFSEINECSFEDCVGQMIFQGAIVRNCRFIRCKTGTGNSNSSRNSFESEILGVLTGGDNLVKLVGCADSGNRHLLSQISACVFEKCKAGDSIIGVESYLRKKGICTSVNNNTFNGCSSGGDIIKCTMQDFGMFNRIKEIQVATESGNKIT